LTSRCANLSIPNVNMPNQVRKTLKLINEICNYPRRSKLRSTLEYMWAWLGTFLLAVVDKIPSTRVRRAITPMITIIIIVIIIAAGVIVVYILIITPTGTTTSTVYP